MMERAACLPKEIKWLLRRDNQMSDTAQNELIQLFAHEISHSICKEASKFCVLELQLTQCTDSHACKQFSSRLRLVDASLIPNIVLF